MAWERKRERKEKLKEEGRPFMRRGNELEGEREREKPEHQINLFQGRGEDDPKDSPKNSQFCYLPL